MILTEIFKRQEQPLSGFVPSKKWLEKGLEIVFVGDQMVWSRRAVGGCLTLTKTGGPKTQMTKFGRMPGFGTTYGTGATDRLDGGILPRPVTGWRSIVCHYYAVSTGGGSLGRIFQDLNGGIGFSAGEILYTQSGAIYYGIYATALYGLWATPAIVTGRWQSVGFTHDQRTINVLASGYLDGSAVSVSNPSVASGSYQTTPCNMVWGNRSSDSLRNWDGLLGPTLIFDGALTADDHAALDRNPWQVFEPEFPELWVQPAGAASPALTNNLATTASGIIVPSLSLGLSNNLTTSATGTLTPVISQSLANNLATTAAGSLGTTAALANNLATSATGTLTPGVSKALSDNLSTTATGALAATLSITLANNLTTANVGSLTPTGNYNAALSNNLSTTATGSLTPIVTASVSNNLASTATGTLTSKLALALVNNALVSDAGAVAAGVSLTLANNLATSASGNLSVFYSATLTNNLATTSPGTLTPKISKALTGVAAATSEGDVGIFGYNEIVELRGNAVSAQSGLLSVFAPNEIIALNSHLTLSVDLQSRIFT